MERVSPVDVALNAVYWFQSHVEVRSAEGAFVVLFLGGFYLIAFLGIVDPTGTGPVYTVVNTLDIWLQVALTVGVPFAFVLLEWLASLAQLRRQPGYDEWDWEERTYVWLEISSEVRDTATLVYIPLAPVAFFWWMVGMISAWPYWPLPMVVFLVDAATLVVVNRFLEYRNPDRLPPGTALGNQLN